MQRTLLAFTLAALFGGATLARADNDAPVIILESKTFLAPNDGHAVQADAWKRWAEDYSREMRTSMGTMFGSRLSSRLVKGQPYSAQVVTEANQSLADGNVITRKTQGAIYRDGEGRTRQETGGDGREPTVYIQDPVAAKSYVLTPGSKKAVITSLPRSFTVEHDALRLRPGMKTTSRNVQVYSADGTNVRIEDGKVFLNGREVPEGEVNFRSAKGKEIRVQNGQLVVDGKPLSVPTPPTPPTPPIPPVLGSAPHTESRVIETKDADGNVRREEIRVQVVHAGDGKLHPLPPVPPMPPLAPLPNVLPMPGIQTMRFESTAKLGKGVTTPLGTKDFDGVKAEGKSTVWTIPAGEIGNRAPINITSESWYSPELQVTVYSRYNDPRTGESIYRLAGIRRGEPGADLFNVPQEYAVKDKSRK